ncbi:twin-arginine translocase TatA/TatE family subunit [Clostridium sp.]|uniref:twin-arginine translocase TatA/TatE family subunit n=1 Tax=Clostridium sp. TaxID=1506 RepID=UPI003F32C748
MFGKLGAGELILILCIALVVFGPSKLPQIGKSMGQAIREFRKGTTQIQKEVTSLVEDEADAK